ncbi:MAG: glycosyltransferase [Sphingobacteriales bacterium]|nr:MAG: glycosyltransferase [Sphingobacteriales bacterium]
MPASISKRKLLVVSDTLLYQRGNKLYGFAPVVRELQELAADFDEIVWLGCEEKEQLYADTAITNRKIKCVLMPAVNHKQFNYFFAALAYPIFLLNIFKHSLTATHVHTRGPAHPALLSILDSFVDNKRQYWHKYAGDWNRPDAPATYRLQRSLLKKLAKKENVHITVNSAGERSGNIMPFENPTVYEHELGAFAGKDFSGDLTILFVGNLTDAKGINELLAAFNSNKLNGRIAQLIIAGGGPLMQNIAFQASEKIKVMGYLNRSQLQYYYKHCHLLVLPSKSEGFPKVVAEAAAHGCIPVVSNISNISQYVHSDVNGFLMNNISVDGIIDSVNAITTMGADTLSSISRQAREMAKLFTYERFIDRIRKEVFIK